MKKVSRICNMFPWISNAKIKEGICVGPQTNKLMNDRYVDEVLDGTEKTA
jgi:hypothetical protein